MHYSNLLLRIIATALSRPGTIQRHRNFSEGPNFPGKPKTGVWDPAVLEIIIFIFHIIPTFLTMDNASKYASMRSKRINISGHGSSNIGLLNAATALAPRWPMFFGHSVHIRPSVGEAPAAHVSAAHAAEQRLPRHASTGACILPHTRGSGHACVSHPMNTFAAPHASHMRPRVR